jgi:hypothetical protein
MENFYRSNMTNRFKLFITADSQDAGSFKIAKAKKVDPSTSKDWVKPEIYREKKILRVKIPERDTKFSFDDLMGQIAAVEQNYGLPRNLLLSMICIESLGDPRSASEAGAVGFAQMREDFRKHWNVKDPYYVPDVVEKMGAAMKHYHGLAENSPNKEKYKGFGWDNSWELAAMMYNRGAQGTLDWLGRGAPRTGSGSLKIETLNYANSMAHLMKGGLAAEIPTMRSKWETVMPLSGSTPAQPEDASIE